MGASASSSSPVSAVAADRIVGSLLGTAVGDALGMPIEGLSHQNVRTYYKGIKAYRDDEKRGDLSAGQWTDDTQFTFAVVRAMIDVADPSSWPDAVAREYVALRDVARRWGPTSRAAIDRLADGVDSSASGDTERPTDGAAMRAAPLGVWWAVSGTDRDDAFDVIVPVLGVTHRHPAALAAGFGQATAVRMLLDASPETLDRDRFWADLIDAVAWAETKLAVEGTVDDSVSTRLRVVGDELDGVPLDLRDACDGAGVRADEAWPHACGMVARRPHLLENTLLSGINVGGDADTHGAMMGAMLGALHGWSAFPDEWRDGLEDTDDLELRARAFAEVLRNRH